MERSSMYLKIWLYTGIALVAAMVIVGGITRLTGSGLSIVEWKPVTGIVPPLNEQDWQVEFGKYQQFPEFQKFNYMMTLSQFKQIFFWEYIHRLLGRLIGLVFLIPFVFFYVKGWITRKLAAPLIIIFLLGGLQGFVGWYMVKSGLSSMPHVSHFRLALHQGMALFLLVMIFWTALSLEKEKKIANSKNLYQLTILSLVFLAIQITLGALVAGLKAGYSYNNFPMMGNTFFPNADLVATASYFYNGVLLQFTHRWFAFLTAGLFVIVFYQSRHFQEINSSAKWLLYLTAIQIILGITTLLLSVPIILGVIHQFMAIFLLMAIVNVLHAQKYKQAVQ